MLYNGLGQPGIARAAAGQAFEGDHLGLGHVVVSELAEAAARTGDEALVRAALDWLSGRSRVTPTEWVLGIEARVRALLSEGEVAERWYRESVERLARTRVRAELARSHLLYGEWLRRERRRTEARDQLRIAHRMLDGMGLDGFAERARRELRATGEIARKRTDPAASGRECAADRSGSPGRAAGQGRTVQHRDRRPAVHQPAYRQVSPEQRLREARHQLPWPALPGTAQRP